MANSKNLTTAAAVDLSASERVVLQLTQIVGIQTTKELQAVEACKAAIADCIDAYIAELDEQELKRFFVIIECAASVKQQKAIAMHPARPSAVQAEVDAARERTAREKDAEKARKEADKVAQERAELARLQAKFGDRGSDGSVTARPTKPA
jgi:ribosomal protein S13